MEFTIRITNPKRAKKFASYLSAFGTIVQVSFKEESESEKPLLEEIAKLIVAKEKAKKAKRKVDEWADNQAAIRAKIASMSEEQREAARIEHENVKRMASFRARVTEALFAHYEQTKDQDPPRDKLVLSIKDLLR